MEQTTAVGVLDKSVAVLAALEDGPASLTQLVERSGLPRATAHRLATALATHRLVALIDGAYRLGPRLAELADTELLPARAQTVLDRLRADTGCSAQLYRRSGSERLCIAASDIPSGLRDTVPVGTRLPMTAGSAAQALLTDAPSAPPGAAFTSVALGQVRRRGWAQSVAERAPGVASVSAPVRDSSGAVVAAVSVSGPMAVMGRTPGRQFGSTVALAARELSAQAPAARAGRATSAVR